MFTEQGLGKPLQNTCLRVIQAFKPSHISTQSRAFQLYQHLLFVILAGNPIPPPPYTFITWISSSSTPNCCWLTVRVFLPICCNCFMLSLYWSVEDVQVREFLDNSEAPGVCLLASRRGQVRRTEVRGQISISFYWTPSFLCQQYHLHTSHSMIEVF